MSARLPNHLTYHIKGKAPIDDPYLALLVLYMDPISVASAVCTALILFIVGLVFLISGCNPRAGACIKYVAKEAVPILYSLRLIEMHDDDGHVSYEWDGYISFRIDGQWSEELTNVTHTDGTIVSALTPIYIGGRVCAYDLPKGFNTENQGLKYAHSLCRNNCTMLHDQVYRSQCISEDTGYRNWLAGTILMVTAFSCCIWLVAASGLASRVGAALVSASPWRLTCDKKKYIVLQYESSSEIPPAPATPV